MMTLFGFKANIEITAEANPSSVETDAMLEFKKAGVNRVSLGIQSLNDNAEPFFWTGRRNWSSITFICTSFSKVNP